MRPLLVSFLGALVLGACAGDKSFDPLGPPQIEIVPASATLHVGEHQQFVAMVSGDFGAGAWTMTWWSSAPAVATVDTGFVTARAPGSALIVARVGKSLMLEDTARVAVQ